MEECINCGDKAHPEDGWCGAFTGNHIYDTICKCTNYVPKIVPTHFLGFITGQLLFHRVIDEPIKAQGFALKVYYAWNKSLAEEREQKKVT